MNFVFLDDQQSGTQRLYKQPRRMITAWRADDVENALADMQRARADGHYLAGYFSYELGLAVEPKLRPLLHESETPLLCFGVFDGFEPRLDIRDEEVAIEQIVPAWSFEDYAPRFDRVLSYIRAGDVYQINLTFPMQARTKGTALGLYQHLKSKQPVRYGGVVKLCGETIISLSPEQFFEVSGDAISLRPMKGTIRRGRDKREDEALKAMLARDAKSRAENLMIVDLLRNDVSRVAQSGTVEVSDLFTVETYPSLHTMTSGVTARLRPDAGIGDWVRALFPCGSVTGAPKIRAMEIIHELEAGSRGVYCGALGYIDPGGGAAFNVAIRTLSLSDDGRIRYPVGGGVVADSTARAEYDEALLKAKVLEDEFGLIETMGWHEQTGFMHLDLHMARLRRSAAALGFAYDKAAIIKSLNDAIANKAGPHRVRLELARSGDLKIQASAFIPERPNRVWRIAISANARDSRDPLSRHKTTRRLVMDSDAKRVRKKTGCDEVVFINQHGEVCEGSYTNIFVKRGDRFITPPLSSGLLPGILRTIMLETGEAMEAVISLTELQGADQIYVGNSLRGLIRANLI